MNWDSYFIKMARLVASKSKDRSTKCGSVVVGPDHEVRATGYNGFCRGADDDVEADHKRPRKYLLTEHGERNAVYSAALMGVSLKGCTMYLNFGATPCSDCARSIIQSGIIEIVGDMDKPFPGKGDLWKESSEAGRYMLDMAGVKVRDEWVEE